MLVAGTASAQHINIGFRGRFTSSRLYASGGGSSASSATLNNVDIGVFPELDYGKIVFQPGIAYIIKGGNARANRPVLNYSLNYLEVPLNVLYKISTPAGKILLGGGPYLAYATSAKTNAKLVDAYGNEVTNKQAYKIPLGNADNELQPFDYGINLLAAFRIKNGIEAGLGTGIGLGNLSNGPTGKVRNQTFSLSLGYFFQ